MCIFNVILYFLVQECAYVRLNERISLMRIAGMMIGLEDLLYRKGYLVESGRLLPFAQESVNRDKLLVYERNN